MTDKWVSMSIESPLSTALHFYDYHPLMADFRAEVLGGLSQASRQLSPRFFYDRHGSELFDAITELAEY